MRHDACISKRLDADIHACSAINTLAMSLEVVECALAEAREFDGAVFPLTLGPKEPCTLEELCAYAASS
jgi:hypothetical protein